MASAVVNAIAAAVVALDNDWMCLAPAGYAALPHHWVTALAVIVTGFVHTCTTTDPDPSMVLALAAAAALNEIVAQEARRRQQQPTQTAQP